MRTQKQEEVTRRADMALADCGFPNTVVLGGKGSAKVRIGKAPMPMVWRAAEISGHGILRPHCWRCWKDSREVALAGDKRSATDTYNACEAVVIFTQDCGVERSH